LCAPHKRDSDYEFRRCQRKKQDEFPAFLLSLGNFTTMSHIYEFVQLDVFTRAPLTGNPLAVFPDARGLTDHQMQALAREMNLSETTFILPREPAVEAKEGKRVRIITVEDELPFAGPPTLGTALYILSRSASKTDEI